MFTSGQQLLDFFNLTPNGEFYSPVVLTDTKVGFSVKRDFPDDISYKPSIRNDGTPNNVAVIWVVYHPESKIKGGRIPLTLRISNMDLYLSRHFDYDFSDADAPTEESVEASRASRKPVELESRNEYFFDENTRQFLDPSGLAVRDPEEILDKIFTQFCDTVHPLKSASFRFRIKSKTIFHDLLGGIISFLKYILYKIFGRTIEGSDDIAELLHGYQAGSMKQLSQDSVEIFGFKAAKSIVLIFCLLIVALAWFAYNNQNSYLWNIADKEIIVLGHTIFCLWILDSFFPHLIFKLINILIWIRAYIMKLKTSI